MPIDTHCHVDLYRDPQGVVDRAVASGVRVVAVTTTPAAFPISSQFTDKAKGVIPALGLHPEVVGKRPRDIDLFEKHIGSVEWIGEVGLDGSKHNANSWEAQVGAFNTILRLAADYGGRVFSIHSRSAATPVIDLLEANRGAGSFVLHWFSGTIRELDRAISLGAYLSVNSSMVVSEKGRRLIQQIPSERLLLETDGPFIMQNGNPIEPAGVFQTANEVAAIRGVSEHDLLVNVVRTFETLTSRAGLIATDN